MTDAIHLILFQQDIKFSSPVFLEAEKSMQSLYFLHLLISMNFGPQLWVKRLFSQLFFQMYKMLVATKQYIGGSLFKSQNGTIWTPSQFQDLNFTLYKAKFVKSGTLTWYNTDITPKGDNSAELTNNPIEGLPRKLKLPVTGTLNSSVELGTKVIEGATGDK